MSTDAPPSEPLRPEPPRADSPVAPLGDGRPPTAVRKALELLAAFRGISPPIGVSELARRAGLPKSTAFRLLSDLEAYGFVQRDGSDYKLGMTLFELGSRVETCRPNGLSDNAMPYLSELHVRTGVTAHLGVLEGSEVVHLARVSRGVHAQGVMPQSGSRRAATCSALGKAILAFSSGDDVQKLVAGGFVRRTRYSITEPRRLAEELARIRSTGVARENEESAIGVVGFASPVMVGDQPVGAVGVLLKAPVTQEAALVKEVRRAAALVSQHHQRNQHSVW